MFPPLPEERMPKMRKTMVSLCAAAALLFTGTAVRADPSWSYAATSVPSISASTFNTPINTSSITFTGGSGNVTGSSSIVIYNMATVSSESQSTPDSFASVPFTLGVNLQDTASLGNPAGSGSVSFQGKYSATGVSSSSSNNGSITWTQPAGVSLAPGALATAANLTLGANTYSVSIVSVTPPGAPGLPGSIEALVTVNGPAGGTGGQPPPTAPEPTSLVLAGLALPALFMARRRLKKAAQA
jgi:hypothetical protein